MESANTFFCDIDGTIVKNLSYDELDALMDSSEPQELLYGVEHFFKCLTEYDTVIFTTARKERHRKYTENTLKHHNLKYKHLIMDLSSGTRIVINDTPNVFYEKARAINVQRDMGFGDTFIYDPEF